MRFQAALGIVIATVMLAASAYSAGAEGPSRLKIAADAGVGKRPSATPTPRFRKQSPYAVARERLVSAGWRPASTPNADTCMEGDGRCQGRAEMESCAGTADANCLFLWRKGDVIIGVSTVGDPAVVASVRCRSGCTARKSK
jgi:hypothetical protein